MMEDFLSRSSMAWFSAWPEQPGRGFDKASAAITGGETQKVLLSPVAHRGFESGHTFRVFFKRNVI